MLGGADGQPICTDLSSELPADGWDTTARRPRLARVARRVGLTGSAIAFLGDLAAKGVISKVLCDFSQLSPPQVEHLVRLLQSNAVPYSLDGPSAAGLSG